ncbi:MAG: PTS-dependent dihydroxyacetone kinase phosphotransferase subunit DhaM [Herpetosiphonaceae bacterium]|nr:PTS-dependent dihydroxyacetone kinase phosphotransferase subunit DhaM [Herpetosiphonaceae bacterium]
MIGMLIVSHSRKIAEGVQELAEQMGQQQVLIRAAGGMSDGTLGTSAEVIHAAATQLGSTPIDGLLVLLDLGSAVLSTEMALEGFAKPFVISDAPLVEGAIMAVIEAAIGGDLERVAAAAERTKTLRKLLG